MKGSDENMIGEAIKARRKKFGMTQEQLAKKIGYSFQALALWEANRRNPTIIALKSLANVLNCTTDELLESVETFVEE